VPDVAVVPTPESGITCGLLAAVSTIVKAPVRFPVESGAKRIVMLQLAEAAKLEVQVLVAMEKSPALAPPTLMLLKWMAVDPWFVTVTTFNAPWFPTTTLSQDRLDGLSVRLLVEAVPVPDSGTDWMLFVAVSLMVRVALRTPGIVGLKSTVIEQFAKAPRLEPHVLVEIRKSVGFVPPTTTLLIVIDEPLLFVNITDLGPPVLPT